MAILDRVRRVDVGGGDWIDIRPLSVAEARELQRKAREAVASDGETESEAEGYVLFEEARARIVAWSDDAEPTPENTAGISVEINTSLVKALMGIDDLPLPNGSPSTDILEASPEA